MTHPIPFDLLVNICNILVFLIPKTTYILVSCMSGS